MIRYRILKLPVVNYNSPQRACKAEKSGKKGAFSLFYDNVRDLCALNRTNITQLAKDLGLSTSMPTKWKNGSVPKSDTVKLIADHFGVSADALLASGAPTNTIGNVSGSAVLQGNTGHKITVHNGAELTEDEREVLRLYRALPMRARVQWLQNGYELEGQK